MIERKNEAWELDDLVKFFFIYFLLHFNYGEDIVIVVVIIYICLL